MVWLIVWSALLSEAGRLGKAQESGRSAVWNSVNALKWLRSGSSTKVWLCVGVFRRLLVAVHEQTWALQWILL